MATVQDAATAYAAAEKHLRQAQKEIAKIAETYKSLNQEGIIGYLEMLSRSAAIKTVIGDVAAVEYLLVDLHIDDYERTLELDIDAGPASGGDDIGVRGGGPR